MIFSDLPLPAEASSQTTIGDTGFAQAGNRYPPRIKCGAGFFGIMLLDGSIKIVGNSESRMVPGLKGNVP